MTKCEKLQKIKVGSNTSCEPYPILQKMIQSNSMHNLQPVNDSSLEILDEKIISNDFLETDSHENYHSFLHM